MLVYISVRVLLGGHFNSICLCEPFNQATFERSYSKHDIYGFLVKNLDLDSNFYNLKS